MSWITTNLAESMGGIAAQANTAIVKVQADLTKLTKHVGDMTTQANRAVSVVASTKTTLTRLTEAGFYMIALSPKKGAWNARLAVAPNAPPNLGYCCGTAVITIAPTLDAVESSYSNIKAAAKKPMADASNIFDPFDFSDYVPEPEPPDLEDLDEEAATAKDWDEIFTADVWKDAALGDIFGGYVEGITKSINKLSKETRSAFAGIGQTARSSYAINKGLTATKNLVAQMQATGVYKIELAPGPGNYLTRLRNEPGSPPTASYLFTSGYVTIAVADSIDALGAKYETLSKIISAGV